MAKLNIPNIDLDAATFDDAHGVLAVEKLNYSLEGQLIRALPISAATRYPTAELVNLFDQLLRGYQRRLSGSARNVIEFGATGDGSTDDTSAIQAAIDVGPGVVFLPAGVYSVTSIVRPGGVTLKGAGAPHTIIRSAAASGPIIGSGVTSYISSPTQRGGGVTDLLVDGVSRDNAGSVGISLAGCYDIEVARCVVQNVELGFYLAHSAYWNRIVGCRLAVVGTGALVTENANENTLTDTHLVDCTDGYVVSEGANAGVSNTRFSHCPVEQFTGDAYRVEASTANAVDGTEIDQPRIENAVLGGTGLAISGVCRGVSYLRPLLVNIAEPVHGALSDTEIVWRGQSKNAVQVGVPGDLTTQTHARLYWSDAAGYPMLRNSADSTYEPLRVDALILGTGVQFLSGPGSPEGAVSGGLGWKYIDVTSGFEYQKTTPSSNTGWISVTVLPRMYHEAFGFDAANSSVRRYASFTSSLADTATTSEPHAHNMWRAPFSGSVTRVSLVHESSAGGSFEAQWFSNAGVAGSSVSSAVTVTPTAIDFGADTGYDSEIIFTNCAVVEGGLYTLALDPAGVIGTVGGWLDLVAS